MDMRTLMIQDTLKKREETHGDYVEVSRIIRDLVDIMEYSKNWNDLYPFQKDALYLIAVKIARMLEGDYTATEHPHDIAGYATLMEVLLDRFAPKVSDPVLNND
mgnify:CR=1 FL=1